MVLFPSLVVNCASSSSLELFLESLVVKNVVELILLFPDFERFSRLLVSSVFFISEVPVDNSMVWFPSLVVNCATLPSLELFLESLEIVNSVGLILLFLDFERFPRLLVSLVFFISEVPVDNPMCWLPSLVVNCTSLLSLEFFLQFLVVKNLVETT